MAREKIGAGALEAYFRHGLRELREATIAFPGQTPIAQESLGMPGNPTSQEVTEMRREEPQPEMEMERE